MLNHVLKVPTGQNRETLGDGNSYVKGIGLVFLGNDAFLGQSFRKLKSFNIGCHDLKAVFFNAPQQLATLFRILYFLNFIQDQTGNKGFNLAAFNTLHKSMSCLLDMDVIGGLKAIDYRGIKIDAHTRITISFPRIANQYGRFVRKSKTPTYPLKNDEKSAWGACGGF